MSDSEDEAEKVMTKQERRDKALTTDFLMAQNRYDERQDKLKKEKKEAKEKASRQKQKVDERRRRDEEKVAPKFLEPKSCECEFLTGRKSCTNGTKEDGELGGPFFFMSPEDRSSHFIKGWPDTLSRCPQHQVELKKARKQSRKKHHSRSRSRSLSP